MNRYEQFRERFKLHHTCGADLIGLATTYSSDCPRCWPEGPQWERECRRFFDMGATTRNGGWWYSEEQIGQMKRANELCRGIIAGAYKLGRDLHDVVGAAGFGHVGYYHLTREQDELVYAWIQKQEASDGSEY